jgi:hypothetical protein
VRTYADIHRLKLLFSCSPKCLISGRSGLVQGQDSVVLTVRFRVLAPFLDNEELSGAIVRASITTQITFEALTRSKKYLLRCDRPILAHNLILLSALELRY